MQKLRPLAEILRGTRPTTAGDFAKRTVNLCLHFLIVYTLLSMAMMVFDIRPDSTLTSSVFLTFGGELVLLLVKRILTQPSGKEEHTDD